MMPGLDGFELLQELRKDSRIATIPFILLSARSGEESRVEGMEAGAELSHQTLSSRELLARVKAHLELARVRLNLEAETRERLQAVEELRSREQMLIQQSRLAAMGEMVQNVAHQWRQPLNVLGMHIQHLELDHEMGLLDADSLRRGTCRGHEADPAHVADYRRLQGFHAARQGKGGFQRRRGH